MAHDAVKKWIAPELADYIDNLHKRIKEKGLDLSKEDVTKIIAAQQGLNGNGKQIIIVVKESSLRSRGKTHKIEEEPYGIFEVPEMRLRR